MRVFDAMLLLAFHLAAKSRAPTAGMVVRPEISKGTGVAGAYIMIGVVVGSGFGGIVIGVIGVGSGIGVVVGSGFKGRTLL